MTIEEELNLRSNLMVLPAELKLRDTCFPTYTMIDSGAEGCLIDEEWAKSRGLTFRPLNRPFGLRVADGRDSDGGMIRYVVQARMRIGDHTEKASFFVTKLEGHPIILGIPWLRKHNPLPDWTRNTLLFNSSYCHTNCNTPSEPVLTRGVFAIPGHARSEAAKTPKTNLPDAHPVSMRAFAAYARRKDYHVFSATLDDIQRALDLSDKADP